MADVNPIKDTADAIKGTIDSEVGKAALLPVAQQTGKALGTVGEAVNAALVPLRGFVWGMKKIEVWVKTTLEEKLKNVPHDRIITPAANVAGPIVEAMRFVGEQPELREMYANLLATSMDSDTAQNAHPAFVEVIRQITPDEARIVALLGLQGMAGVLTVESVLTSEFDVHSELTRIAGIECEVPQLARSYIDNLKRLGIVEASDLFEADSYYTPDMPPAITAFLQRLDNDGQGASYTLYDIALTALGDLFYSACVDSRTSS